MLALKIELNINDSHYYRQSFSDCVVLNDVEILVRAVSAIGAPSEIEYRFSPGVLDTYQVVGLAGETACGD
jgi:hypothetical protein